jgi:replicative DNA helicase
MAEHGPIYDARSPLALNGQRLPPASLEAEQALLGALLANNKAYDRVAEFLRPDHFADAIHGRIFAAIARRVEAGRLADGVTLRQEFEASGELAEVGGAAYIAQLLGAMVGIINAGEYGRVVLDMYQRRQILDACEEAVNASYGEGEMDAPAIADRLDGALLALREGGSHRLKTMEEVARESVANVAAAAARGGGVSGITWGYRPLDRMTGGLHPGQLIVIGARPSMGKTALAVGVAARAAAEGARVLFVSAEMLARGVADRVVAAVSGVPLDSMLRGGSFNSEGGFQSFAPDGWEMRAIGDAARRVSRLPILWDDAPSIPLPAIRARARGMRRKGGLDLIVVDYLGMLAPSVAAKRQNRVYEVSELASGLKALAKELELPVLLLSQLNRGVEGREEKMPGLSDLRDSGSIEQDADVVGFIHRPHYYLSRSIPTRKGNETGEAFEARKSQWYLDCQAEEGKATILLAKQRQGPTGPVRLHFVDQLTWFLNSAPSAERGSEPVVPGLPE